MTLFGFNDDPLNHVRYAAMATDCGANAGRVVVPWNDLSAGDAGVAEVERQRQTPIVCVWGTAEPNREAFRQSFVAAANRWPNAALEVWNEPNHELFGLLTPAAAAGLTVACADSLPGREVIGPAVSPITGYRAYLDDLYSRIPPGKVGVGIHIYPDQADPIVQMRADLDTAAKHGEVYVTEFAINATRYGGWQAWYFAVAIAELEARADVEAAIIHRLGPPLESYSPFDEAFKSVLSLYPGLRDAIRTAFLKARVTELTADLATAQAWLNGFYGLWQGAVADLEVRTADLARATAVADQVSDDLAAIPPMLEAARATLEATP